MKLPARAVLMLSMGKSGCCCPGGAAELERRVTRTPVNKHPPPPSPQAAATAPDPASVCLKTATAEEHRQGREDEGLWGREES